MGSATPTVAPPESRQTTVTARINLDRLAAFKAVAAANHRTVSDQLRWMIDRAIDELGQDDQPVAA